MRKRVKVSEGEGDWRGREGEEGVELKESSPSPSFEEPVLTTSETPENLSNMTALYPPGTSYREAWRTETPMKAGTGEREGKKGGGGRQAGERAIESRLNRERNGTHQRVCWRC